MSFPSDASESTVEVPQEVADIILDLLADDAHTLKSCALISRQWRPRSQHHLHNALTIKRQSDVTFLEEIYADALLASYVHTLAIEVMWWPFWISIQSVLRRLPSVRALTLTSVGGINAEMHQLMTGRFTSLTALSLNFITFDDFPAFSRFLNDFPYVEDLSLKNVYWARWEGLEEIPDGSIHRFRTLQIAYCTQQDVLVKWMMGAGEKLRPESLVLTWYEASPPIQEFMRALGEHLQHFTFSYVFSESTTRGEPLPFA